jgi:ADP-ribosylglycohydrolase
MNPMRDRAHGALLGLAAGDASGFPAAYHRTIGSWRRGALWSQAMEMDASHINKFPLPFSLSDRLETAAFSATDDAEQAALGAALLLRALEIADGEPAEAHLFTAWRDLVLSQRDAYWGSVADRSAILNAEDGSAPPATGSDNPHFYDDSSVARSVPVGILFSGDPDAAARMARALATITNDGVGVDSAASFAAAIALAGDGSPIEAAVTRAVAEIPADSWFMRKYRLAESILAEAGSPFAAVPRWSDEVSNLEYNFGNVAAETVPLALIIAREAPTFSEGIGVANLITKQADTMPAMVGALLGCVKGTGAIPPTWRERVETLRGVCVPSTRGVALQDLADRLVAAGARVTGSQKPVEQGAEVADRERP